MKKIIFCISILLVITTINYSQGSGGTNAKFEYRQLIDLPTAGILEKGYTGVSLEIMPLGVLITKIEVGVFSGFNLGVSYGGSNIVGTGNIVWYKLPGVSIRGRVFDETTAIPAITVGFDSQGKGIYDKDLNRYEIKSPGFFAAASKNFEFLGYLSVHGIINYTLERDDDNKSMNIGCGVEKTIGGRVSIIAEYNLAINDKGEKSFGKGNGYLNFGARWSVGDGLTLGINFRDLLENKKLVSYRADRGLYVEYVKSVF